MNKRILQLAIPNIISNITVPLLGMVDMFIVGHLEPDAADLATYNLEGTGYYIGAIALANMVFNAVYMCFSFLRMGTSGFAAQAYGAENWREATNILLRSLFVALVVGILIVLSQMLISYVGFTLIERDPLLKKYALDYFSIYVWSAPAILGMYALNGWYIGMQDAKVPMFIAIGINAVNIALSFIFVYIFKMKIEGVALASLCAQYSGFIASFIVCNIQYKSFRKYIDFSILKNLKSYLPFFKVNSNIFLRTLALISVTSFFTSTSAQYGHEILAVNALLMQLFMLYSYLMDGFAYSAEALTGRFVGARDYSKLRLLVKKLFMWGAGLAICFSLIYALFSPQILRLLTNQENILELSSSYLHWALVFPIVGFAAFLWDGIFIGATASKQMRNSMLIAAASFFIIYYGFHHIYLNNTLWIAFISYLAVRGIVQTFMARSIFTRLKLEMPN